MASFLDQAIERLATFLLSDLRPHITFSAAIFLSIAMAVRKYKVKALVG